LAEVEDNKIQEIDLTIKCETTLEVIKIITVHTIQSKQHFIDLTVLQNKIMRAAHDAPTNHGTVLNFQQSCLN